MKARVTRGRGFRGLLLYALDRGDRCRIVGGNMSGQTVRQLAAEFGVGRRLRPDIERPVWHCSLSLPEGEHLDAATWDAVCHAHMRNMGLDPGNHQFVAILHTDTLHEHVHVVASRIGLDRTVWHGVSEIFTAQFSTQSLEAEFGLTVTKGSALDRERPGAGPRAALKLGQDERVLWEARGRRPPKAVIAEHVAEAVARCDGTPDGLARALAEVGVEARVSVGRGAVTGISYAMDMDWPGGAERVAYKGSAIGARCDARSIEARLAERRAALARAAAGRGRMLDAAVERGLRRVLSPDRIARLAAAAAHLRRNTDAGQEIPRAATRRRRRSPRRCRAARRGWTATRRSRTSCRTGRKPGGSNRRVRRRGRRLPRGTGCPTRRRRSGTCPGRSSRRTPAWKPCRSCWSPRRGRAR